DVEALGHLEVYLDGTALPGTADAVMQVEVDLRAIEGTVALVDLVGTIQAVQSLTQSVGCSLPVLITAHGVLGTGGQFQVVFEAEYLVNAVNEVDNAEDLIHQLIGSAEDVGIVLSEAADTHQAMQGAAELMTVYNTQLTHADGQVTI